MVVVAVVLVKQKRCGGGADIKTIKYCGGDGGAMIKQWKCGGGVDSSGKTIEIWWWRAS